MSRTNSMGNFSSRWLLPVLLLNVFVSTGLQEHLIELVAPPQTEQMRPTAAPAVNTCSLSACTAPAGAAPVRKPRRCGLHFPEPCMGSSKAFNYLLPGNNLLRFYGKPAPEALDRWAA